MKFFRSFRLFSVTAMIVGLLVPQFSQAAQPVKKDKNVAQTNVVRDVSLQKGNTVYGQVLDASGVPQSETIVQISTRGKKVVSVKTNKDGTFRVANLRGGVYRIASTENSGMYRLWAAQTAPPSADQGVLLINDAEVVRGQLFGGGFFSNPILIGGLIIGAAVAIPIALDNDSGS